MDTTARVSRDEEITPRRSVEILPNKTENLPGEETDKAFGLCSEVMGIYINLTPPRAK